MDDYQDSPEDLAKLVYGADPKHPEGISVLEVVREQVLQQFYAAANAAAKTICDIAAGRIAIYRSTDEDQDGKHTMIPGARLQFEAAKRVLEFVVEPIKTDLKANADDAMIRMITTLQGKED